MFILLCTWKVFMVIYVGYKTELELKHKLRVYCPWLFAGNGSTSSLGSP